MIPTHKIIQIFRLFGVRASSVLLSLAFSVLAARLLGVATFGDYATVMAIVGLLTVAAGTGLPQLLSRETASARGSGSIERLAVTLQGAFLLVVACCIITFIVGLLYGSEPALLGLIILTSLIASFSFSLLDGLEKVEISALISGIFRPATALLTLLLLVWMTGPSVSIALSAQIISSTMALVMAIWFIRRSKLGVLSKAIQNSITLKPNENHRLIAVAGVNFALIQVLINATQQAELLWLSALSTPQEVAHFFAASRAGNGVSLLHASVLAIYAPKIVRLHGAGEFQARDREALQASKISFISTLLIAIVAASVSGPYLRLFGANFVEAQIPMIVILGGWVLISALGPVVTLMITLGRERDVWIGIAGGLVAGGLAAWVLIPKLGILGAALSFNIMIVFAHIYLLPILRRRSGFVPFAGFKV